MQKNKAYVAESTFSDISSGSSLDSESEEEEYVTVCLMALDENKVCDSINDSLTIDEVIEKYDELATTHQDLEKAYDSLSKTCEGLAMDNIKKENEIKVLQDGSNSKEKKISFLKDSVTLLTQDLEKFIKDRKNL